MSMFKSGGADSTPRLKQIRYDLRKKILAVVGGTVLVCTSLLLVFSFFWSHYQQEQFIRESVRLSTEGVREFIVRQRNWKTTTNLHELRLVLRSVISSNPYISRVVVYDEAGVIAGLFNDINRKLQQRINDLEKLNKLAIETNSELDRVLLHNIIVTKFAEATGAKKVALIICDIASGELTRVYIRRFFNQRLHEEIQTSAREKTPLSLLALDIDHFKNVNDTYGHQTGDVVLQAFAHILQQATRCVDVREAERRRDIIARTGSEEFSVILPKTSLAGAKQVSERIRQAVESYHDLKFGDGGVLKFTVSIGVAERMDGQDAAELMRNADSALYEATPGGRNRVVGRGESAAGVQVQ